MDAVSFRPGLFFSSKVFQLGAQAGALARANPTPNAPDLGSLPSNLGCVVAAGWGLGAQRDTVGRLGRWVAVRVLYVPYRMVSLTPEVRKDFL